MIHKLSRYSKQLSYRIKESLFYPVTLNPTQAVRGRVLFSYLEKPLLWDDDAPEMKLHSNKWESREIAHIFTELGYIVDAINFADETFQIERHYDIVFDICWNLARFAPYLSPETLKILHSTGSDPYYQNKAELARVEAVNQRRNGNCELRRSVKNPEIFRASLNAANFCSLIGSAHTLSTYPPEMQSKIHLVNVSGSPLSVQKSATQYALPRREFLWFFGYGAIHKGLDIVLEVFAKLPNLTLHIVGDVMSEKDFSDIYKYELTRLPNVFVHGALTPESKEFSKIVERVFSFIAPSCSEGISPAVVTCLQAGLYPILSKDTGVVLPAKCGTYLTTCSIDEVIQAVQNACEIPEHVLRIQIELIQKHALEMYSRENFRRTMRNFLSNAINTSK